MQRRAAGQELTSQTGGKGLATPRNGEWHVASSLVEERWEIRLQGYKDEDRLMNIVKFGVVIMEGEIAETVDCPNYRSFEKGGEVVDSVLREKVERDWIVPWSAPHNPRIIFV